MFTNTSSLHELERLMTEIPNFTPRGHGVMILCKHEYTAKNCDCPYHTGREKKIACGLDRCSCLKERIVAETATTKEILTETMAAIKYPPFVRRLNQYLKESEINVMNFKNEQHRRTFTEAIRKLNRQNYALMSALYLLTADCRLWMAARRKTAYGCVCFEQIHLPNCSETAYTLFCAAKDLYIGTKHLSVSDLADTSLISPKLFGLICNAMAIRRFGLGAIAASTNRGDEAWR